MGSRVSISAKQARAILNHLEGDGASRLTQPMVDAFLALRAGLAPKPKSSARKKTEKRRRTKRTETSRVYRAVEKRADGLCESCGDRFREDDWRLSPSFEPELDHFFGRKKEPQTERNCWLLHQGCHSAKSLNIPCVGVGMEPLRSEVSGRDFWLIRFAKHARKYGYTEEAERAEALTEARELVRQAAAVAK